VVDICAAHSARGAMLPARLRLEQREVKRPGVQTRKFAVPVLDLDVHPLMLGADLSSSPAALPSGNLTPVPPQDGATAPSIAEQLGQIDAPPDRQRRANAAALLPSTGLLPRTAVEAHAEVVQQDQRSAVLAVIEELPGEQQERLKEWFREADLPPVRRMDAAQCQQVMAHLLSLPESGDPVGVRLAPTSEDELVPGSPENEGDQ
jgi:hypothetical protein